MLCERARCELPCERPMLPRTRSRLRGLSLPQTACPRRSPAAVLAVTIPTFQQWTGINAIM